MSSNVRRLKGIVMEKTTVLRLDRGKGQINVSLEVEVGNNVYKMFQNLIFLPFSLSFNGYPGTLSV